MDLEGKGVISMHFLLHLTCILRRRLASLLRLLLDHRVSIGHKAVQSSFLRKVQLHCLRRRQGLPTYQQGLLFPPVHLAQSVSNAIRGLCHLRARLPRLLGKTGISSISRISGYLQGHLVEVVEEARSGLEAEEEERQLEADSAIVAL